MGMKQGESYNFPVQIRSVTGATILRVQLYGEDGSLLDSVDLKNFSGNWQKVADTLHPKDTDAKARLAVLLANKGTLDVDFIFAVS